MQSEKDRARYAAPSPRYRAHEGSSSLTVDSSRQCWPFGDVGANRSDQPSSVSNLSPYALEFTHVAYCGCAQQSWTQYLQFEACNAHDTPCRSMHMYSFMISPSRSCEPEKSPRKQAVLCTKLLEYGGAPVGNYLLARAMA